MATTVSMPKMGFDMTQGKILRWLKAVGDKVEKGEAIAEIETDKVNIEVEAFASGVLARISRQEGDTVPVGDEIAMIAEPGEKVEAALSAAPTAAPQAAPRQAFGKGEGGEAPAVGAEREEIRLPAAAHRGNGTVQKGGRVKASPLARRMAHERGIDLAQVPGSGPGGRVTRDDVEAFVPAAARPGHVAFLEPATPAAPGKLTPVPLSRMREAIGRKMAESKGPVPHYYVTVQVAMGEALALRERLNEATPEGQARVSVNDLVVKAVARALEDHPEFNATWIGGQLTRHEDVNVAMAIALEDGLVSPAILGCQRLGLAQLAQASKSLVERAKASKLRPEEYTEGTFTVSNLGMFDVEHFIAIVTPPQVGILAVGSIIPTPVASDGTIAVAQLMKMTLSADHRATDGAMGAKFLGTVKQYLQHPYRLLV